jgi:hypothetical protein
MYNNLKASWDSLMEAASHGNPRSFYVAVTVALEQVKREELKRKNAESKKCSILPLISPGLLLPTLL